MQAIFTSYKINPSKISLTVNLKSCSTIELITPSVFSVLPNNEYIPSFKTKTSMTFCSGNTFLAKGLKPPKPS